MLAAYRVLERGWRGTKKWIKILVLELRKKRVRSKKRD